MNPEPEPSRLSFRCGICGRNWPFHARFMECPVCEEETRGIRFTRDDAVMSYEEANEVLDDQGLARVTPPVQTAGANPAPAQEPPASRHPTADEINTLYAELRDWSLYRPWWYRSGWK